MYKISLIILFSVLFAFVCRSENDEIEIFVDESKIFQTINGFGASDAWRCQFVGKNWPLEKRNKIADLLFSLEVDYNGNPKGIGLSSWRFYLGSGSAEQGEKSNIQNMWRRSECFIDSLGNYDWSKCEGQRWFLKAAKKRGVEAFQIFTISPPVFYTKNGKAYSVKGDKSFNLKNDRYDDYVKFLVDVIRYFQDEEGVEFDYVSPFNEPQWDWGKGTQEGTPASNAELFRYIKCLSDSLHENHLATKIIAGEAGHIKYLYNRVEGSNCSDQVNVFFNPASEFYIGDLQNLEHVITGHSYYSTWPLELQITERLMLNEKIKNINPRLDYWQTEFCVLEKNDETTGGWGRDLGMNTALYVARVIHTDLTIANACSWDWWTALSQFNFKDGLIHLDKGRGNGVERATSKLNHKLMMDGEITETKLLWAMGNFSRFIRPGMVRVDAQFLNNSNVFEQAQNMQCSAFKNMKTGRVVVVFINHTANDKMISCADLNIRKAALYVTDRSRNLEKIEVKTKSLKIPGKSVSTLVFENN